MQRTTQSSSRRHAACKRLTSARFRTHFTRTIRTRIAQQQNAPSLSCHLIYLSMLDGVNAENVCYRERSIGLERHFCNVPRLGDGQPPGTSDMSQSRSLTRVLRTRPYNKACCSIIRARSRTACFSRYNVMVTASFD